MKFLLKISAAGGAKRPVEGRKQGGGTLTSPAKKTPQRRLQRQLGRAKTHTMNTCRKASIHSLDFQGETLGGRAVGGPYAAQERRKCDKASELPAAR